MFFEWKKEYETGIEKIDIQHKVILKILNELYRIIVEEQQVAILDEILDELVSYTKYHFSEEERLFEQINYNNEIKHKAEHRIFFEKIQKFIERKEKGEDIVLDLVNFLANWLIDHILVSDQGYVSFIKENSIKLN